MAFRGVLPPRKPYCTKRLVGPWQLYCPFYTRQGRFGSSVDDPEVDSGRKLVVRRGFWGSDAVFGQTGGGGSVQRVRTGLLFGVDSNTGWAWISQPMGCVRGAWVAAAAGSTAHCRNVGISIGRR